MLVALDSDGLLCPADKYSSLRGLGVILSSICRCFDLELLLGGYWRSVQET